MTLATTAALAKRWGLSRQRVDQLAAHDDFPPAELIQTSGAPMRAYDVAACDEWFAHRTPSRTDYHEKRQLT